MRKKRAVAYCRVSTDKEDQLNSLAAQQEYFRIHTKEHGYELIRIYADEGITGTKKRNRKEFLRMLQDAKKGIFDVLFVKDVSRFARNTLDSLESIRMLKDCGVDIVFINNQGILEAGSELMFTLMSAMAQEESVNMSKRVKFGKEQNARKGRVPNIVYGYDKKPGEYFSLHINEEEAEIVRRIFSLYTGEGMGCLAIANKLNAEGRRTKRGCMWSQNAITRIIRNEIYIGRVVNGKEATKEIYNNKRIKKEQSDWIVVENPELKIIDEETYYKAQQILHGRYDSFHIKKERQSNKYLFSTLIKCRHCHRSFRRVDRQFTNTHYIRWVCSSRNGDGIEACSNATKVKEDELLEEIIKYLERWLHNKEAIVDTAKKQYLASQNEESGNLTAQKYGAEIDKCRAKLKRLQELYMNDLISMEEIKSQSQPLKIKIQEAEEQIRFLEASSCSDKEIEKRINVLSGDIYQILNADTLTNEMLKKIIEKIEVDESGNIEVFLRKLAG